MTNDHLLLNWMEESRALVHKGQVADYIPALAQASPDALGITIHPVQGSPLTLGDCDQIFTLQSISKVFTLILALMDRGEEVVFSHVGMEPTGDNFKSILKLELVPPGKPFNPMINAGAITVTSLIGGETPEEKWHRILAFIQHLASDPDIGFNEDVYESEKATANRNRSLGYFLKDVGVLEGKVEEQLDVYFKHCAIEMTCKQLARLAVILANNGLDPDTSRQLIPAKYVRIAKTFMVTCGMYNASGEFAIRVGIPAKSGVSGSILALVPGRMGIGIIGPSLDEKGNSIAGMHMLERMSEAWEFSMF
ncbi:glutaminase A [Marinicrinis sediminis]|uniref:Glutaminase n=1 Tax=Marinicrinis sediminis TaxID=1652465 RepID=A0ABW5R8D4_9BACL